LGNGGVGLIDLDGLGPADAAAGALHRHVDLPGCDGNEKHEYELHGFLLR
jgi:hypothetical protein